MRVRVHSYRQQGNDWIPFLEDGRQVHLAAQPGGQETFLALTEREGLYSSCRGTGKSLICGMTFGAHVGLYGAAWKGLLLRPTITGHTEMKSLLEQAFMAIWGNTVHYNINTSTFSWDSGEILKLGHFGELSDYSTWIGQSWPWIGWEELTQFPNDKFYKQMLATNRSPVSGIPLMVRSTCNPGGSGHEWVRRRFDPPPEPKEGFVIGRRIEGEGGLSRRAVCSVLEENQRLLIADPTYKTTIAASAIDAGQLEAWTTGSWNIQAGGLMESVWYQASEHFILDPIPVVCIPNSWTFTAGFDWGQSSSPSALLWAAISDGSPIILPDKRRLPFVRGDFLIFDELYTTEDNMTDTGNGATIEEIKREAIEKEIALGLRYQDPTTGRWVYSVRRGVADDQIFTPQANRGAAAPSLADEFERPIKINGTSQRGMLWEEADKSSGTRARGWEAIRGRMMATIPPRENPGLYITRSCPNLLRTLQALPRDPHKPNDCPKNCADHLPDVTRYLLGKRHGPTFRTYRHP